MYKGINRISLILLIIISFSDKLTADSGENKQDTVEQKNNPSEAVEGFGDWSISKELFRYIRHLLPDGKTILELGSGWATGELAKYYTLCSIEHNLSWVGKYSSTYIHAPLKQGWYDVEILKKELPAHYDLILVDGPPGLMGPLGSGRIGFLYNLSLFNTNVPIIFDDVDRPAEYCIMNIVAHTLKKPFQIFEGSGKKFAVIS